MAVPQIYGLCILIFQQSNRTAVCTASLWEQSDRFFYIYFLHHTYKETAWERWQSKDLSFVAILCDRCCIYAVLSAGPVLTINEVQCSCCTEDDSERIKFWGDNFCKFANTVKGQFKILQRNMSMRCSGPLNVNER